LKGELSKTIISSILKKSIFF